MSAANFDYYVNRRDSMKARNRNTRNMFLGFLVLAVAAKAHGFPDTQNYLQGLDSPDAKTRRAAIVKFNDGLAKEGVKEYDDSLLQVILKATMDSDAEVRRQGFGALNLVSHVIVWRDCTLLRPSLALKYLSNLITSHVLKT